MENKPYIVLEYNDNLEEILLNNPEYDQNEIFNFKGRKYITLVSKKHSLQLKKEREILFIKSDIYSIYTNVIIISVITIIISLLI